MENTDHSLNWQEGFFSASDGTALLYRIFLPPEPTQTLVILHGFGEHSLRYEKFSNYFPNMRIAIFDMRGMGRSEGERVFVESFDRYEQDALDFLQFLDSRYPSALPQTLLGHSLGGLNLMRLCARHSLRAQQFIFSAPCFHVAAPLFALELNRLIESVAPRFLYHNPVYFRNLTHDPQEMLSYKTDNLIMRKMTARLLNEMVKAGKSIEALSQISFHSPVHFLLAGEDKLVRTDIALRIYENISAPSKTLNIYKNFYHEIFNESEQKFVFDDLLKILSQT